jgi:hypothetical protein
MSRHNTFLDTSSESSFEELGAVDMGVAAIELRLVNLAIGSFTQWHQATGFSQVITPLTNHGTGMVFG